MRDQGIANGWLANTANYSSKTANTLTEYFGLLALTDPIGGLIKSDWTQRIEKDNLAEWLRRWPAKPVG